MNLVTLENISKQYGERPLFTNISLLINEGDRIGLIGVNGSGKTTLLRIVAGLEQPDNASSGGTVTVWGGVRIQYLSQEPQLNDAFTVLEQLFDSDSPQVRLLQRYEDVSQRLRQRPSDTTLQAQLANLTNEMEATGGWAAEANVKAVLTRLGITDFEARIGTLSGGQRKRVALARALIDPADLLILDEPTNHIDADTIAWLEEYVAKTAVSLLLVTHDRYFLDRVANRIVELDRRELVSYPGNYSRYVELKAERQEQLLVGEQKRQQFLKRELEWLRRAPTARGTKQKARKQRIEELQQLEHDSGSNNIAMALASRRLGKRVLEAANLSKAYGDLQLFHEVNFELVSGDRIGIIGPNGVGKSTLLDILAGFTQPDAGEVKWGETVQLGYYDQQSRGLRAAAAKNLRVIEFINELAPLVQTDDGHRIEAAQMLEWFMFTRPQQQSRVSSLSGGERRRLYLLSVLVRQPNVLLLDEPTNDLDIPTLTVLEEFLDHFKGCVVVVSHDRYFLDRTVDFLAVFEDGRFSPRYPAPYEAYQARRAEEAEVVVKKTAVAPPLPREARPDRPRKLSWNEKRELEALDGQVAQLEEEQAELQGAINNIGEDYERLEGLVGRLQVVEAELDNIMERWLELSELGE
ncbi:MAG: ABC-F family ATP-binding cassette domain-containing protein [Ardenticatenaceae bacterium]|nr:ABC-F family ATP-binding cassette domain-containing protein [Ardenticatenaceae bacterium]